ncbi:MULTISPECIES: ROK family transcriptional regulator [Saccharothrix]|uniref:Sugar kinase n=2 Tax=Saccharothrix TaxID=2071 RepID=A0ABU0X0I3_9PSEU|nr:MULTISPECIES: ROK family transcriptional regulator [Saccharothrix]MDQ2585641.1 sugar kinase [Saccharothrix yanglingensis]MDR6598997.1 putative NBD/HSP70 family sugar kinase/biotin operon repressor [Saccharothrix longispora]MDU0290190.1 ROK family protein [Saccharothrix longispora]
MSTPTAGARPDEVRRHNRTALLRRLHVDGPSTRASLAAELGLNRSTIKALVDGLAESGVVAERVPAQRSGAGRPSLLVLPQPQAAVVMAIDIRVEQVAMAMVGLGGDILGRDSWNLHQRSRDPGEVITHIADSAKLLADELDLQAVGVGVSVPGVVRRHDGLVHEAPNLHWTDVALGQRLSAVLKVPVQVGNDAELGALAEHVRGAARGSSDMVYISADVGIGGGVISSGQPLRGTGGYVGELGHMVVRPGGRRCYCGCQGCWETEVGEPALCRALALPENAPRGAVVAELRALAGSPDTVAHRLGEFTEWLAMGLVTVVNMLGPELVVLGDLFTALPESLVDQLRRTVQKRSLVSRAVGGTRIVSSPLGRDAKLVGAAELAFEPVLGEV